jgi:glycosyltransferase involved in cell wall biosynthesis
MEKDVLVSICCITYNHEKYISDAIESFLMQKTNFNYEILIHDDASTDSTAEIIKGYEKKYPKILKPIYQIKNQYSQGVKVGRFNLERARAKYIAVCEGDDYWIDPYKLQKQVDYMEKHPGCSMCVHAAYIINEQTKKKIGEIRPFHSNRIVFIEEIIEGGGALFATNSVMYRSEFAINRPNFFDASPVGDRPLFIYLALNGQVYYFDDFMSVYRTGVSGSWTNRVYNNINKRIQHDYQIAKMLDEVNEYTDFKYETTIDRTKRKSQFGLLVSQGKIKEAKSREYIEFYRELDEKNKVCLYMTHYCPSLLDMLKKIKRKKKYE